MLAIAAVEHGAQDEQCSAATSTIQVDRLHERIANAHATEYARYLTSALLSSLTYASRPSKELNLLSTDEALFQHQAFVLLPS